MSGSRTVACTACRAAAATGEVYGDFQCQGEQLQQQRAVWECALDVDIPQLPGARTRRRIEGYGDTAAVAEAEAFAALAVIALSGDPDQT